MNGPKRNKFDLALKDIYGPNSSEPLSGPPALPLQTITNISNILSGSFATQERESPSPTQEYCPLVVQTIKSQLPIRPDVFPAAPKFVRTVEMHTAGEPTRIIYSGFPQLQGHTLLAQRADAMKNHDRIRSMLMLEPRGHKEMYGALLVEKTEKTISGVADIGVLFMHKEGWSTMCGHASIALGRFLVDFDEEVCPGIWPGRNFPLHKSRINNYETEAKWTTNIKLHCPAGVVELEVPIAKQPNGDVKSDPKRKVGFFSVECFATGTNVGVEIVTGWPQLGKRRTVTVDICYGGAFYCVVSLTQLGFFAGLRAISVDELLHVTAKLKNELLHNDNNQVVRSLLNHPIHPELNQLYGIIIVDDIDTNPGRLNPAEYSHREFVDFDLLETVNSESGICIFGDRQVDRSPCGSGVSARTALAYVKGERVLHQRWSYHSPLVDVSEHSNAFVTEIVSVTNVPDTIHSPLVRVKVEGSAFYTGFATYMVEGNDFISDKGFLIQ